MPPAPWWIARVTALLAPDDLSALQLGALFRLSEELEFVRQNVDASLLAADVLANPTAEALWGAFGDRERLTRVALAHSGEQVAGRMRRGELGKAAFFAHWQQLGYAPQAGAGTPADDFLDGLYQLSRFVAEEERPPFATPNLGSRAQRVADFLSVTQPGAADVVVDLGSGSGKLALTVAASCAAQVRGVELVAPYVAASVRSAAYLGLPNAGFVHADAREADLSKGTIFYLYHPFHGPVARAVAGALGAQARERDITVYAAGPAHGYGEHFLDQVERGALRLVERRGEFGEALVLRSERG